jgi:hypothetical protein
LGECGGRLVEFPAGSLGDTTGKVSIFRVRDGIAIDELGFVEPEVILLFSLISGERSPDNSAV